MAFVFARGAALPSVLARMRGPKGALVEVVRECCDRLDASEPHVRALLPEPGRRERLLLAASQVEQLPAAPASAPLRGLLLGVKDTIAAEGFPTRCGSMVPPEANGLPVEASVVRRLRGAGMILAGKTVSTEFAHVDPGATANPWNVGHTPGGSSSGSAAAVAAGTVHVALGTQTIGSVGRPAAFCGICGFKPTYGRVPTDGVAVYSQSVDTVGFFTPDAEGMEPVCAAAVDDWDGRGYGSARERERLPVLGVPEGAYLRSFAPASRAAFEESLASLAHAGVEIRRVRGAMEDYEDIAARHTAMTLSEWARSLSLQWSAHASLFRARTAMEVVAGLSVPAEAAEAGRRGRARLRDELLSLMDASGVDLWVTPGSTQGVAPKGLESTGIRDAQLPWTHAGFPTLSLPSGLCRDYSPPLPLGLQLAARPGCDELLLGWGARLEACGLQLTA